MTFNILVYFLQKYAQLHGASLHQAWNWPFNQFKCLEYNYEKFESSYFNDRQLGIH